MAIAQMQKNALHSCLPPQLLSIIRSCILLIYLQCLREFSAFHYHAQLKKRLHIVFSSSLLTWNNLMHLSIVVSNVKKSLGSIPINNHMPIGFKRLSLYCLNSGIWFDLIWDETMWEEKTMVIQERERERETFYAWTWLIDVLYMNLSDAYPPEHHILCCK